MDARARAGVPPMFAWPRGSSPAVATPQGEGTAAESYLASNYLDSPRAAAWPSFSSVCWVTARAPAHLSVGEPGEIAELATYTGSEGARYVTGSTFDADGGLLRR